jgi:4-amino-4-deoxy-L-arabinose transferase-like glycosyltransferase
MAGLEREAAMDFCPNPALPRSFLAYLPFLWSRVLFPGESRQPEPWSWRRFVLLLVIPGILLYPCLSFYLFEPDEARYAQIPKEMLERGDWIVPVLQGKPYLDKPPLLYWLVMLSYAVFGAHDWAARLVPALAVHGCILMTYFLGRRLLGEKPAWWGALVLAMSPAFMGIGRLLVLDGVLTFCVALSILSAFEAVRGSRLHRGWWALSAVACGLGILTKGPVAILLLVPPLWLHVRLAGKTARIRWTHLFWFAALMAGVALPWYVAVCRQLPEFVRYFLWEHNVIRFVMPFDHQRPVWFYVPIILAGMLPAMLLLAPFVSFLLTGKEELACKRSPEFGFTLLAGGWCILFFSLSGSKLPTYVLPGFPFLALAFGYFIASSVWERSLMTRTAVAAGFMLLAVVHYAVIPWVADVRSPMNDPDKVWEYCRDRNVPVVCYPRPIDSVAFYLDRSDFLSFRGKETPALIQFLQKQPTTVILFSHRHSLAALKEVLPPELTMTDATTLGLCHMAVVYRRDALATMARPRHLSN